MKPHQYDAINELLDKAGVESTGKPHLDFISLLTSPNLGKAVKEMEAELEAEDEDEDDG